MEKITIIQTTKRHSPSQKIHTHKQTQTQTHRLTARRLREKLPTRMHPKEEKSHIGTKKRCFFLYYALWYPSCVLCLQSLTSYEPVRKRNVYNCPAQYLSQSRAKIKFFLKKMDLELRHNQCINGTLA